MVSFSSFGHWKSHFFASEIIISGRFCVQKMGNWEKDNYKTIPLLMKRTMIELTKGRTSKLSNISGLAHYVAIKIYVMSIIFVKMSPPTIKAGVCEQCRAVSVISRKEQHATKIII